MTTIRSFNIGDRLVLIYLIYIVLNALISSYPHQLQISYKAFLIQFCPIFCYYVGRTSEYSVTDALKNIKWFWLIAAIIGLYAYFKMPGWYVNMKNGSIDEYTTENRIMEIFRLSSIWPHPYQIGYATMLFMVGLLNELFIEKERSRWQTWLLYFFLVLCVVILLLAQLRAAIAGVIIAYVYFKWLKGLSVQSIIGIVASCMILVGVYFFVFSHLESSNSNYIVEHVLALFDSSMYSDRLETTSGGLTDYSLFGDGFGCHSGTAQEYGGIAILDSEYQKHILDLGYIGLILLIVIVVISTLSHYKNAITKTEMAIIFFYIVAMVGASALSNHHQYNYIFWFCLGRIWQNRIDFKEIISYE